MTVQYVANGYALINGVYVYVGPGPSTGAYKPGTAYHISSDFVRGNGSIHGAVDYGAPAGTAIYADANGVVVKSGLISGAGYGVIIEHTRTDGTKFLTFFLHMSGTDMPAVNQSISVGQMIGRVGTVDQVNNSGTGANITGTHLHVEIVDKSY